MVEVENTESAIDDKSIARGGHNIFQTTTAKSNPLDLVQFPAPK